MTAITAHSSAAGAKRQTPRVSDRRKGARSPGKEKIGPSPRLHMVLAALTVLSLAGAGALVIAALGDPSAASPQRRLILKAPPKPAASTPQRQPTGLKERLAPEEPAGAAEIAAADQIAQSIGLAGGPDAIPEAEIEAKDGVALPPPADKGATRRLWGSPDAPGPQPLARAPIAGVHKIGPAGPLPIIAPDGRTPFGVYRRPFNPAETRPRIAIVLGGLGLNSDLTQAAIRDLPPEVTLSFVPYVKDLQKWIDRARAAGHETLVEAPLEPFDYPDNDTGPYTLLANADPDDNQKRLEWILSRATGFIGIANYQGAKFANAPAAVAALQKDVLGRGLMLFHNGGPQRAAFSGEAERQNAPFAAASRVVDDRPSAEGVDQNLLALEALALDHGKAIGSAFAYPVSIEHLRSWAKDLPSRGYALAPISAVTERAPRK